MKLTTVVFSYIENKSDPRRKDALFRYIDEILLKLYTCKDKSYTRWFHVDDLENSMAYDIIAFFRSCGFRVEYEYDYYYLMRPTSMTIFIPPYEVKKTLWQWLKDAFS